jgi:formamidopyrimidine-DNA glycosylase
MPEGPEATYLSELLKRVMVGKRLLSINILRGRYHVHDKPRNFNDLLESLPLKCTHVENKGKVIFIYFENNWCIVSKLGMTGWWYEAGHAPTWRNMYPNIIFTIGKRTELHYSDFRNFGTLTIYKDTNSVDCEKQKIAPDILSPQTTFRHIMQQITSIKEKSPKQQWLMEDALVDQKLIVSGIGNYLKSEVLYDARISPLRSVKSITQYEWKRLYNSMKDISKNMLRVLRTQDDNAYMNSMQVYSKDKDSFGNVIKTHITKNGRVTYWVPDLQK